MNSMMIYRVLIYNLLTASLIIIKCISSKPLIHEHTDIQKYIKSYPDSITFTRRFRLTHNLPPFPDAPQLILTNMIPDERLSVAWEN